MATHDRLSSAFDALLEANRRQLDALGAELGGASTPPPRLANSPGGAVPASAEPAPSSAGGQTSTRTSDGSPSAATQALRARYGESWRFEVSNRRRENDEVIVLGRLTLTDERIVRAQFGSARVSDSPGATTRGSADGVQFSLGEAGNPGADQIPQWQREDAAYGRAREDALAKCLALL